MAKVKTTYTDQNVIDFINLVENEQQRKDSFELIELFKTISGHEPQMFGSSIVGFGNYHYKYESGHEGDAPLLGFSPRKTAISVYAFTGLDEHSHLLENLGKYKMGKACIYVKKLSDINLEVLTKLSEKTINYLNEKYPI